MCRFSIHCKRSISLWDPEKDANYKYAAIGDSISDGIIHYSTNWIMSIQLNLNLSTTLWLCHEVITVLIYTSTHFFVGFFRVVLREQSTTEVISSSNTMSVAWGDYYSLSSPQQSVFPCAENLIIQYTRPKCVTREDNIHMFAVKAGEIVGQVYTMLISHTSSVVKLLL